MKKLGLIFILALFFLTGCSIEDLKDEIVTKQSDIDTYIYEGDIQFVPISYQHIDDGTVNGLDLIKYVDLNEGTIYLYTEKFKSGFGITWTLLVDNEGNPVIYEDLEGLRERVNWKESEVDNTQIE